MHVPVTLIIVKYLDCATARPHLFDFESCVSSLSIDAAVNKQPLWLCD